MEEPTTHRARRLRWWIARTDPDSVVTGRVGPSPVGCQTTSHKWSRAEVTSVSGLWTPGDDELSVVGDPGGAPAGGEDAAVEEELRRVRAEIASTPAVDIVANHAIGLWQLAVLHLSPEPGQSLRLSEAAVAIDAMGGLVEALGDRLGEHAEPLRGAVTQLRLAFVEVQRQAAEGPGAGPADA